MEEVAAHAGISRRTIHRYFNSREALLSACFARMLDGWQSIVLKVCKEATTPLAQLENLLYAAIDLGDKFGFLMRSPLVKLPELYTNGAPLPETAQQYQAVTGQFFSSLNALQKQGLIDPGLPIPWIRILFTHIVLAANTATDSGEMAPNQIKKTAWLSLKRSLAIA